MRETVVVVVSVLGFFAALVVAGLTYPDWKHHVGVEDPPVGVFLVGSEEAVQKMRQAIAPERILVSTHDAIVLREGRVIAASAEAVGEPVTAVGWVDREIQIMSPGSAGGERLESIATSPYGSPQEQGPLDEAEAQRFAQLSRKPTLTWGETHELLRFMERSGQF